MTRNEICDAARRALCGAPGKTVVLIGDFCLDVYYHIDSKDLEPSLETGLMVRRVKRMTDSLGGAGNVFANLCALGAGKVIPVGVVGPDLFGCEMQSLLGKAHPGVHPLLTQETNWVTPTYMKPMLDGREQERIDLGLGNSIAPETEQRLLDEVERALDSADVVMINQQLEGSIYTDRVIEGLNALAKAHPQVKFIVDSRTMQHRFHGMWHKLNTHELASGCGIELDPMHSDLPVGELKDLVDKYFATVGDPVIVSRGEFGAIAFDGKEFASAEGITFMCELDTVGAGDSFFSGFALSLASGLSLTQALHIGNGVAGVTVQKLHQTGTATPDELMGLLSECDYLYNCDADTFRTDTPFTMEVITPLEEIVKRPAVKYAVFDHDGTISVLREGWEEVMEACMMDAITGGRDLGTAETEKIRSHCREFITRTTGIQTICQMMMLVDEVRAWGLVPESEVKTAQEYKNIYNDALMDHMARRVEMARTGVLKASDATIEGSIALLKGLAGRGVKIYLASGTDQDDVCKEAALLGYADCFTGGIFGSVGDVKNDPKRQVLKKILHEQGVDMEHLVIFGDGPVEMREARSSGALAFGVLSDEVRRSGWNEAKHSRLLYAGADILVPDFREYDKIISFLLDK